MFVHERGARHLIDPSKLMASATRLYGKDMDRLWGAVAPVPAARVRSLYGDERLQAGGRQLEVAQTPGHASHHVTFFDAIERRRVRRGHGRHPARGWVLHHASDPASRRRSRGLADERRPHSGWDPDTLFLTHFGPFRGARTHFQELFERLDTWSGLVRRLLADASIDDQERERRFVEEGRHDIRRTVGEGEAEQYVRAGRLDYSWQGLARYWRSRLG